jgi:hypothetical protein
MSLVMNSAKNLGQLLATGQTTQYSSELDDGYYRKGLPKSYNILTAGQYAGTVNIDLTYLVSDTGAFTASTHTYTDNGKCGVFKAAGGETIVISGAGVAGNNGIFTTASATANTVVVTAGFADEADAPSVTFKKRGALSNNCVLDNQTGLMWARYCSVLQGIAGDGKMPWTGSSYDIFDFCAAARLAFLGGYNDWRIPNIITLLSIADYEAPTAAPNSTAFPSWPLTDRIWSSTIAPSATTTHSGLNYTSGNTGTAADTTAYFCALVRG